MDSGARAGDNVAVNRTRLWLVPLLLAVMVGGAWYFGYRSKAEDRELPVYVTAGERMAAGGEIYQAAADKKPFTYPPFAALPFVPFAALPANWQPAAWFLVNFAMLVGLVTWFGRWAARDLPGRAPPRWLPFWFLVAVVGGRHVASVLTNQSHDLFIAGAVALAAAAWCRGRSTAGVWVGIGAAVKATPLLFVGLFVLRGRWLALGLLAAAAALATLWPDWWFPRSDGRWWGQVWFDVNLRGLEVGGAARGAGAWNPYSILNQSLSGTLLRLFTTSPGGSKFVVGEPGQALWLELSPATFKVVNYLAQAAVLGVIGWGILRARRAIAAAADPIAMQAWLGLGEVAAIACGMVLLSPQSSKSHFCVWLFPVAFVVDRLLRGPRDRLALALFAAGAVVGLLAKDLLGTQRGNLLLGFGNVTWATVLLLLATVRCLHGRQRDVAP
jgi:alpha-1,2-mannosyltransferase